MKTLCSDKENISAQIVEKKGDIVVWGPSGSRDKQRARLPRIICYGDSNTVGFHSGGQAFQPYGQSLASELEEMGVPCEVAVCGLCNFTTQEMLNGQAADVMTTQMGPNGRGLSRMLDEDGPVKLVIIMTGTNDLGFQKLSQTSIVQQIAQLHGICHKRGIPTVSVAPTQTSKRHWRGVRQQLADLLAKWAASVSGVLDSLDVEDIVPRPAGKDGTSNNPATAVHWEKDDLHLSSVGSIALGRRLAPHVSTWLQRVEGKGCNAVKPTGFPMPGSTRAPLAAVNAMSSNANACNIQPTSPQVRARLAAMSAPCPRVSSVKALHSPRSPGRCGLPLAKGPRRQQRNTSPAPAMLNSVGRACLAY